MGPSLIKGRHTRVIDKETEVEETNYLLSSLRSLSSIDVVSYENGPPPPLARQLESRVRPQGRIVRRVRQGAHGPYVSYGSHGSKLQSVARRRRACLRVRIVELPSNCGKETS